MSSPRVLAPHLLSGARDGDSHFPGQPFGDKIFHNIHSKPPLGQLEAISSRPIACDVGAAVSLSLSVIGPKLFPESRPD